MKPGNWRLTASKNCPECTGRFNPRVDESVKAWDSRKFCGNLCRAAVQKRQLAAINPRKPTGSAPLAHWKTGAVKTCANCEKQMTPRPKEGKSNWAARKFCNASCRDKYFSGIREEKKSERMYLPVGTVLDPAEMYSPGERLRWLRISYSTCGRKTPWTTAMLAEKTEKIDGRTKLSVYIIEDLEKGTMKKLRLERTETACMALGVPVELLSVSQKKFVKVVKSAGLMAKTINNQRI